jgi:4-amino-4-deoxy-L-arabinose transferase-like glycosyltransferase
MNLILSKIKSSNKYLIAIVSLIILRAYLNYVIPLMDKTEARYAEISRIMAETNDWIVLQIDYGIPFWAKPPLSTWLSASSISMFGLNEFFVRLPFLILSIFMIFWITSFNKHSDKTSKFVPGLILFSLPEFFLHSGVVSTDTCLSFGVFITFFGFWKWVNEGFKKKWIYIFFIGLSIGILSKGPIALILSIPPLLAWILRFKINPKLILKTDLIFGFLLLLLLSSPWYYLNEKYSPGFINYFIIGEHFQRFFDSNWIGDKYGFPKSQPIGIIWGFLFLSSIPWIFLIIKKTFSQIKLIWNDKWRLFLFFWLLWTPMFFTISKSLIHPYILPVMTPIALLVYSWWSEIENKKLYFTISLVFPILSLIFYFTDFGNTTISNNTDKFILKKLDQNEIIYSLNEKSYSSQFYTNGKIQKINKKYLDSILSIEKTFTILINHNDIKKLKLFKSKKIDLLSENNKKGLYKIN